MKPKAKALFLPGILALVTAGVVFFLVWLTVLSPHNVPLWAAILNIAIILRCAWPVVWGIIQMVKQAFRQLNKNENDRNKEIFRSADRPCV